MKKIFTLLFAVIAGTSTTFAEIIEHIQIGELYYNLDIENRTAEVTYQELWSDANYSGLTIVSIPESVKYNSVTYSVISIRDHAFNRCYHFTQVKLPNSLKKIGDSALGDCYALDTIFIPKNVEIIGAFALIALNWAPNPIDDVSNLQAIVVDKDNLQFTSVDGVLYDKEVKTLIQYPTGKIGSFTIPTTVDSIATAAAYASRISELTISENVKKFGELAFMGCQVKTIHILEGVTEIVSNVSSGGGVFSICRKLEHVTLPNSLKKIGEQAFSNCPGIQELTLGNDMEYIGSYAFTLDVAKCSITCLTKNIPIIEENSIHVVKHTTWNSEYNYMEYEEVEPSMLNVYVPANKVEDYKADKHWGKYTILPINTSTSLDEIDAYAIYGRSQKILRNDQIYILRGDKTYTITGAEVK